VPQQLLYTPVNNSTCKIEYHLHSKQRRFHLTASVHSAEVWKELKKTHSALFSASNRLQGLVESFNVWLLNNALVNGGAKNTGPEMMELENGGPMGWNLRDWKCKTLKIKD